MADTNNGAGPGKVRRFVVTGTNHVGAMQGGEEFTTAQYPDYEVDRLLGDGVIEEVEGEGGAADVDPAVGGTTGGLLANTVARVTTAKGDPDAIGADTTAKDAKKADDKLPTAEN